MDWAVLLARYRDAARGRDAAARVAIVARYLAQGGDASDRRFGAYLRDLQAAGYADGTVDRHRRVLQAFFRWAGVRAPQAPGWTYDPETARRPALSAEAIAGLIAAARAGQLTRRQAALLAISTTYGLRAQELAAIRADDFDWEAPSFYVRTAKHGRRRRHWLPPAIAPWCLVAWPRTTAPAVDRVFAACWAAAFGTPHPPGVAWHSIRRALVRDLEQAGVPDRAVIAFLRWRSGADRATRLAALYGRPTETVGPAGAVPVVAAEATPEADAAVWARHPYLRWWGEPD